MHTPTAAAKKKGLRIESGSEKTQNPIGVDSGTPDPWPALGKILLWTELLSLGHSGPQ